MLKIYFEMIDLNTIGVYPLERMKLKGNHRDPEYSKLRSFLRQDNFDNQNIIL